MLRALVRMLLAVEQEVRESLPRVVAGARRADQEIRIHAVADPGLLAVDDEVIAVAACPRLDLEDVRADVGF